ncbi:MAG: hypothetical protein QW091_01965 [Candidatus Micrarchaeaceae archaeon]
MRGQLATFEAILAISVSIYSLSYMVYAVHSYNELASSSIFSLHAGAEAYDLASAIESNASAKSCIESSNATCIKDMILQYERVYGVGISIYLNGEYIGNENLGKNGNAYCFNFYNKTLCMLVTRAS